MAKKTECVYTIMSGSSRFIKLFSDGSTEDRSTGESFPPPSDRYELAELLSKYYRIKSRKVRKDFEEAKRKGINGHPSEDDIGKLESLRVQYIECKQDQERHELILQEEPERARRKFAEEQREKQESERKERVERIKEIKLPDEVKDG